MRRHCIRRLIPLLTQAPCQRAASTVYPACALLVATVQGAVTRAAAPIATPHR